MVSEHICNFSYFFDWNNVKILDVEHNFYKRSVAEMWSTSKSKKPGSIYTLTELLKSYFEIIEVFAGSL